LSRGDENVRLGREMRKQKEESQATELITTPDKC